MNASINSSNCIKMTTSDYCASNREMAEIHELKALKTLLAARLARGANGGRCHFMPHKHLQKAASLDDLLLSTEPRAETELVIKDGMAYVLPSQCQRCRANLAARLSNTEPQLQLAATEPSCSYCCLSTCMYSSGSSSPSRSTEVHSSP